MKAHDRLVEWGKAQHYAMWGYMPSPPNTLQRLVETGRDDRFKGKARWAWLKKLMGHRARLDRDHVPCHETAGVRMEIIDGVPCPPDGGLGHLVDLHAALMVTRQWDAIQRDNRVREVREWLDLQPEAVRQLVRTTYLRPSPREDVLSAEETARRLGVSRATYFRRRTAVLDSLKDHLCLPDAEAA